MEDGKKKDNKKWLLLLLLLLLLLFFYVLYTLFVTKPSTPTQEIGNTSSTTQAPSGNSNETGTIIKCQNVVVTPLETTELFTYVSGKKVRADYRIGASTNESSFKTQILSDGEWVYMWNPANVFDSTQKPENPPGLKMNLAVLHYNVDMSQLGVVSRFGASPVSGDHMCNEWDDADPVFEVPADIEFIESPDIQRKIQEQLNKICQTCDRASSDDSKSTCRKNLGCE